MLTVMIPALNEEKNIYKTAKTLLSAAKDANDIPLDIVIVNDGSTDETKQEIEKLEKKSSYIRSIHHKENLGIGASLSEVIKIAKYPHFLLIPGDNVVSKQLLVDMILSIGKADLIISYFINKEIRTRLRNFLSALYGIIYMGTFNVYVQYLNSVCIYPTEKIRKLVLISSRYSIPAELTIKLLCQGNSFLEVPGLYLAEGQSTSTSISIKNLWEIIYTYFFMIFEMKIKNPNCFRKKPVRIINN